ncbi:ribosomal protein S14 [Iris pallida]|uniref:Ribosomal protein S14 (Chloroplast) n=1 Tax=Iris pallida TaxID=29817 RepID=A0AAX6DHT8_IRIPA|nr:ribosomal protein S14 [Iris pallida]
MNHFSKYVSRLSKVSIVSSRSSSQKTTPMKTYGCTIPWWGLQFSMNFLFFTQRRNLAYFFF